MNPQAFKQFLEDEGLSLRKFSKFACRRLTKSTLGRMSNDGGASLTDRFRRQSESELMTQIRNWLSCQGRPVQQIDDTLKKIFEEDYTPMPTERVKLDHEQLEFFGLRRDPFALESDPRRAEDAFTSKELDRLAERIKDAIFLQGFLCILGPIGAGKTTLKHLVADKLKEEKVHLIYPKFAEMGKLNAGGIVHYVLEHFEQRPRIRLPLAQRQLEKHLQALANNGEYVALVIDEAHRLNEAMLSAFKNFYELGSGGFDRYLAIVFYGQPQFKTQRLEAIAFREIAERLEVVNIPSVVKLNKNGDVVDSRAAGEYIAHRLKLAGHKTGQIFDADAVLAIARQAQTPLAIGNVANKALIAAYTAGENKVIAKFVEGSEEPTVRSFKKAA